MSKFDTHIDYTKIDGNAFNIMGVVAGAIRRAGGTKADVDEYTNLAMSGDYDNLLRVSMQYVAHESDDD